MSETEIEREIPGVGVGTGESEVGERKREREREREEEGGERKRTVRNRRGESECVRRLMCARECACVSLYMYFSALYPLTCMRLTSFHKLTLTLFPGTHLYSTVHAVDAAGLASAKVHSDGVVIDSSPPQPVHKFRFGPNLLQNPSFEEGAYRSTPSKWTGSGIFYFSTSSSGIDPQDDPAYLDIASGYIEQTIATVKGKKYRMTFYVRSPDSVLFYSQHVGFVRLPEFHAAFAVAPSPAHWQKHLYFFIASDTSSTVRIGAVGRKTGFLLDGVNVQEVSAGRRVPSADPRDPVNAHVEPMHVHVTSRGSYTAVTAAWDVEDPESPVTGHSWAIGTVRGESCVTSSHMLRRVMCYFESCVTTGHVLRRL